MPGQDSAQKSVRQQAERDRPRVPRQERAAGRRLDRARHDVGADHRAGARSRREQGLLRLGRAAGAVPERLRHRHAAAPELVASGRSEEEVAAAIGADWLIYQDLEDLVTRLPARRFAHQGIRHFVFLGRVRDRRRDARIPRAHRARALRRRARPAPARPAGRAHRARSLTVEGDRPLRAVPIRAGRCSSTCSEPPSPPSTGAGACVPRSPGRRTARPVSCVRRRQGRGLHDAGRAPTRSARG